MDRFQFLHHGQEEAYQQYQDGILFQENIEKAYDEIDFKMKLPDFLGKTVKVSEKQFPEIYQILLSIAKTANIAVPPVYVYEDYYYGAESYGISQTWIELSAKTIQDFTKEELQFVLAREIYKITDGVTRQKTMMEERFQMIRQVMPDKLEKVSKISFYQWYRLTNYSADNYGYIICKNIKSAINAILKMVLNSKLLVEQINVMEFINQASEINRLDDMVFNYTKADESVPYAPHRIQNLLAYAISDRGMKARKI